MATSPGWTAIAENAADAAEAADELADLASGILDTTGTGNAHQIADAQRLASELRDAANTIDTAFGIQRRQHQAHAGLSASPTTNSSTETGPNDITTERHP